jgi:hypothetical protein
MKTIAMLILLVSQMTLAQDTPKPMSWPLNHAFVPIGFDDNDKAQVTVEGVFPTTCYRVGPYSVEINEPFKTIALKQQAYKFSGSCIRVFVLFSQVMDLGFVKAGNYKLIDGQTGSTLGEIPVAVAKTSDPDDYFYAPISDAWINKDPATGRCDLNISGSFSNRCTKLKRIDVRIQTDVVVVQPIAEHITTEDDCKDETTRFSVSQPMTESLTGTYLLHVRSLNGQAVNKIVDLR